MPNNKIDTNINAQIKGKHLQELYCTEHGKIWGGNEALEEPQSLVDFANAHFRYYVHFSIAEWYIRSN